MPEQWLSRYYRVAAAGVMVLTVLDILSAPFSPTLLCMSYEIPGSPGGRAGVALGNGHQAAGRKPGRHQDQCPARGGERIDKIRVPVRVSIIVFLPFRMKIFLLRLCFLVFCSLL